MTSPALDLPSLSAAYRDGAATPVQVLGRLCDRIEARGEKDPVWIHRVPRAEVLAEAGRQTRRHAAGEPLPLYGVPFAVKDNLDVAGLPTTAACPDYRYIAGTSSPVVARLVEAGAIVVGKTNLDQFAAGLVGTRTPYGACSSVFDPRYVSGGSSSGSAVAVAAGLATFALGTDTAGSGRVPAAYNNLVGWKPTRGLLSTRGLVPACRSLDCVSVFALTCVDAWHVARAAAAFDGEDPYSRKPPAGPARFPQAFRFGVPSPRQLDFFGNIAYPALYFRAVERLAELGGRAVEIDFEPFLETARLLYSGPWLAERYAAVETFFETHRDSFHPVTRQIVEGGAKPSAVAAFRGFHELEALRRRAEAAWEKIDLLLLPTVGTHYTIAEVEAAPVALNTNLGRYTNFVNLLDLCGVAVPGGFTPAGLPFGITLLAPAFRDEAVCELGSRFHAALGGPLGGTGAGSPAPAAFPEALQRPHRIPLAVVGAHLEGQPLHPQLTTRGAEKIRACRTAPDYRLYALPGTQPPKPGLVRSPGFSGPGIEVEVWSLDEAAFGSFVAEVPPPLAIGTVVLDDGTRVKGFVCEPSALEEAEEITRFGGWRAYRAK